MITPSHKIRVEHRDEVNALIELAQDDLEGVIFMLVATREELMEALSAIAMIGGNLSDDNLTSETGPNDAKQRGIIYCAAREIARNAIARSRGAQ